MENIGEETEDSCNKTQSKNGQEMPQDATECLTEEQSVDENTEHQRSRSSSVPADNTATEVAEEIVLHSTAAKNLDTEATSDNLIDQALQQEDEFLNYLMSLPAASAPSSLTETQVSQTATQHAPLLMRSFSTYGDGGTGGTGAGSNISSGVAKVGLDHLDNLCKLMEQLGDLREQNSKLQRRVKYLEDLKKLQEMHKQLQEEETRRCETHKTCYFGQPQYNQYQRNFSMKSRQQCRREIEKNFPSPCSRTKESVDASTEGPVLSTADNSNWRSSKCKSLTNSKFNQSSSRYQQRERSKSVGVEELKLDQDQQSDDGKAPSSAVLPKEGRTKQVQRRSLTSAVATGNKKAKVSKWTKVKEAFKWEKASVVMVSGTNTSQECDINGNCHHMCCKSENMQLLNTPNTISAPSPVGSVISGHSSYSSGGYSPNVTRFHSLKRNYSQDKADFVASTTLASASFLSSSSSSEDLDIEQDSLNFTRPQRSASATDSTHECMVQHVNTRRCSLVHGFQEDETSRRSKSLDGENRFPNKNTSSDSKPQHQPQQQGQQQHQKAHKTPWGKVKDIIQTRKDSLKKRHQSMKSETCKCDEDQEEKQEQSSMMKISSATAPSVEQVPDETAAKETVRRARLSLDNTPSQEIMKDVPTGRRLTPMLTLTLPSTEELRNLPGTPSPAKFSPTESTSSSGALSGTPNSPQIEERHQKISVSSVDGSVIDKDFKSKSPVNITKSQIVPRAAPSSGMSPPTHRRASKWTKVKKAFLTGRRDEDVGEGRISNSVPSSPNRNSSFFEEMDTEEVNSGEFEDHGVQKVKQEDSITPTDVAAEGENHELMDRSDIHAEIQRNYEELQMKLTQEFHKKLTEWEIVRSGAASSSVVTYKPTCRGQSLNPASTSLASTSDAYQRSTDRNEVTRAQKDAAGLKVFDEDNLSPHFRKKLQEWQRMKKAPPAVITAGNLKDDSYAVTPQFRKKIAEWQLWKTGSGKAPNSDQEQSSVPPEEFGGKVQQWESMQPSSSGATVSSVTNTDSLSSIKGDANEVVSADESNSSNAKTPSPKANQKEGLQYLKTENKTCQSVTNKSGEFISGDDGVGSNEVATLEVKNYQKGKSHKYKELHWLEKELQKIEREKQRLEREREKYLEREARLEKMRLAVGAGRQKQEVLIQTSTGFFRFQGISEKFTRRLYEWEKARGIGPEASTFALLDPGYRPPLIDSSMKQYGKGYGGEKVGEGSTLARSKSAGSVSNLGNTDLMSMTGGNAVAAIITHQSSSLSLNDVEVLEKVDITSALEVFTDSRAASEPHICISEDKVQDDEPAAMIVDVEDVVVETAAPLPASPIVSSQTPVYSYAPEEVSQLIDSSGSDEEYNDSRLTWKEDSKKEYNYNLLEENINLLQKLKMKEDICKKLENEIEGLEGKIEDVAKIHELELQHLEEEEKHLCSQHEAKGEKEHEELVRELKVHIRNLEHRQECLRQEEEQLQDSFIHHSEQQATLAHSLVNKVKQLQEANMKATSKPANNTEDRNYCIRKQANTVNLVQQLSTQLIQMAEKLEIVLAQRNTEIQNLKLQLRDQGCHSQDKSRYRQHWSSEEDVSTSMSRSQAENVGAQGSKLPLPRQSSDELIELPALLTNKVLELKELLSLLCVPQDTNLHQIQDSANDSQAEESDKRNTVNNVPLHFKETSSSESHTHTFLKVKAATCYDLSDFQGSAKCEKVSDNWQERKQRRQHKISHLSSSKMTESEKHNKDHSGETEKKYLSGAIKKQKVNDVSLSSSKSQIPSLENIQVHNLVDSSKKKAEVENVGICHERSLINSLNQEVIKRKEGEANRESCCKSNSNTKEFIIDESDVDEESTDESDKTEEEEEEEDEEDDDEEEEEEENDEDDDNDCYNDNITNKSGKTSYEEPRNIRKSQLTNIKARMHTTENKSDCMNVTKTQFLTDVQENRRKDYETEVHSTNRNERKYLNERHKSLKTRRISDTHIGYKHQKYDQYDKSKYSSEGNNDISQLDSNDENNQTEGLKPTRNNQSSFATTSSTAANIVGAVKTKADCNIKKSVMKGNVQALDEVVEVTLPLSSKIRKNRPSERENRAAINFAKCNSPAMSSSSTVHDNAQLKESMSVTPDNVFVKTTRKIFSPVRRDSKGKPSSVISYTVGESPPRTRALEDFDPSDNSSSSTKETAKLYSGSGSGNLSATSDKKETNESAGTITPPSWVIMRNTRSQSSSPALMRRKVMPTSSGKNFVDEQCVETAQGDQLDITKFARQKYVDGSSRSSQERKLSSKVGSYEETSNSSVTPSSSFPPIPQSPGPTRRDLLKVVNKETAPSIRMMIAKYNQKLTDGKYGNGGRGPSPEVNAGASSGSASPVAWRSPVAERRVLAQMERYQEEVRRVLTKGSNKLNETNENNKVKKSASAGLISVSQDNLSKPSKESKTSSGTNKPTNTDTHVSSVSDHHKGISKSSSAGTIKPEFSPLTTSELKFSGQIADSHNNKDTGVPLLDHSSANLKEEPPAKKKPPVNTSLSLDIKYNAEGKRDNESNIFCHSDLPIQPRALKLQRAKQEFLTRGPTEASKLWSNDTKNASTNTVTLSENTSKDVKDTELQDNTEKHHKNNKTYNRLSQISVGSDILVPVGSEHSGKHLHSTEEGLLLVKSASAGMINIDQSTYCGIVTDSHSSATSDGPETKAKISQGSSKFGISSITSKFRKVKMRKSKETTGSTTATNKMNTVTTLCRQSLLVDLHLSKGNNESITKDAEASKPSTSKSCPSSPVLQRPPCGGPTTTENRRINIASGSWICNPARKIFKPK